MRLHAVHAVAHNVLCACMNLRACHSSLNVNVVTDVARASPIILGAANSKCRRTATSSARTRRAGSNAHECTLKRYVLSTAARLLPPRPITFA
eukprot:3930390-Pleurochrysis_carterae.AAC.1